MKSSKRSKNFQVVEKDELREGKFHEAQEYLKYDFAGGLASYRAGTFYLPCQPGRGKAVNKLFRQLETYGRRKETYKTNSGIAGKRKVFLQQAAKLSGTGLPDLNDLKALERSSIPLLKEFLFL